VCNVTLIKNPESLIALVQKPFASEICKMGPLETWIILPGHGQSMKGKISDQVKRTDQKDRPKEQAKRAGQKSRPKE
jgi:hypothetical protein